MNTQGPDDATMMTLLEQHNDQKERFLTPLLNGEKRICYSMTEKRPALMRLACRRQRCLTAMSGC